MRLCYSKSINCYFLSFLIHSIFFIAIVLVTPHVEEKYFNSVLLNIESINTDKVYEEVRTVVTEQKKNVQETKVKYTESFKERQDISHNEEMNQTAKEWEIQAEEVNPSINQSSHTLVSQQISTAKISNSFERISTSPEVDKSKIIQAFIRKVETNKHYPYIARKKGIEGVVVILVHLDENGNPKTISIRSSSGSEILDRSALELIKKACPFRHNLSAELKVEIPVAYRLDNISRN